MSLTVPVRPKIEALERRQLLAAAPGFFEAEFATGLSKPTAFAFAPDGRLFVAEQNGKLQIIKDGALLPDPALTLDVDSAGERGLIGLAFDPAFATNQLIYLHYTTEDPAVHNRVSRFTVIGDTVDAASEQVLKDLPSLTAATNHNGGAIHFGLDGKLYIAVGDNNDPSNAQPGSTVLGKILRLNPDGSTPEDNPFIDSQSVDATIWARGLRNPYTFAFRSDGLMFINDVGQSSFEEINVGQPAGNYGWPITEGKRTNEDVPPGYVDPLLAYGRDGGPVSGSSIAGAAFYETPAGVTPRFPAALEGDYLFADWGAGFVKSIDPVTADVSPVASGLSGPLDLAVGPDGSVYVLEYFAGRVTRIDAAPSDLAVTITAEPDAAVRPGQRGKVNLRIDNVGDVGVRGQLAVRLLASTDAAIDASDLVLKDVTRSVRLDAGGAMDLRLKFRYPQTLDGAFTIVAEVVPIDGLVEADLVNNVALSSAQVLVSPPFIDLSPTIQPQTQPLLLSGRNRVKVDLENRGNVRYSGNVAVTLSVTPQAGGAATQIAAIARSRVIPSLAQRTVTLKFRLPDELPAGAYDLSATIVAAGRLADVDPSNDVDLQPVTLS